MKTIQPPSDAVPAPGRWKGKGRVVLSFLFFGSLTVLALHPGPRNLPPDIRLKISGLPLVSPTEVRRWLGPDPQRTLFSNDRTQEWLLRHPWVERISFKHYLWGGGVIMARLKDPVAVLRPSHGEVPGKPATPWGDSPILAYLLPDGKAVTGRLVAEAERMPQVIVRAPLTRYSGERLAQAIRDLSGCRGEGAPDGRIFVYRGSHEIRFFPDRTAYYIVLPEDPDCTPYVLFRKLAKTGGLSGNPPPKGFDLRFKGMILIRPDAGTPGISGGSASPRTLP